MDAFAAWLSKQSPTAEGVWVMHIEFCVSAAAWEAAVAAAAPSGSIDAMAEALSRLEREAGKAAYRCYRGSGPQKFSVHFAVGDEYREVPLVMTSATDANGRARVVVELQQAGLRVKARRSRRR